MVRDVPLLGQIMFPYVVNSQDEASKQRIYRGHIYQCPIILVLGLVRYSCFMNHT